MLDCGTAYISIIKKATKYWWLWMNKDFMNESKRIIQIREDRKKNVFGRLQLSRIYICESGVWVCVRVTKADLITYLDIYDDNKYIHVSRAMIDMIFNSDHCPFQSIIQRSMKIYLFCLRTWLINDKWWLYSDMTHHLAMLALKHFPHAMSGNYHYYLLYMIFVRLIMEWSALSRNENEAHLFGFGISITLEINRLYVDVE